jgi:hypothetical protein
MYDTWNMYHTMNVCILILLANEYSIPKRNSVELTFFQKRVDSRNLLIAFSNRK